jgi:hypothetical protein
VTLARARRRAGCSFTAPPPPSVAPDVHMRLPSC